MHIIIRAGYPKPSENDDMLTDAVRKALGTINVSLQEHVIVSDDGFYSYRKNGYFDIDLEKQKEVDDSD